jgi:hypothetical protein
MEIAGALSMITAGIMTETGMIGATTATIMAGETTTTTIASQFWGPQNGRLPI